MSDKLKTGKASYRCEARLVARKFSAGRSAASMRIPVEFLYTTEDPWAIHVHIGRGRVACWSFARSMLDTGRVEPIGAGAVHLQPLLAQWVEITHRAGELSMLLSVDRDDVDAALFASEQLVPFGAEAEHLDVDAELARWITPGRTP